MVMFRLDGKLSRLLVALCLSTTDLDFAIIILHFHISINE